MLEGRGDRMEGHRCRIVDAGTDSLDDLCCKEREKMPRLVVGGKNLEWGLQGASRGVGGGSCALLPKRISAD